MREMRSGVVPCLCYRNAIAAIDWLSKVFGFSIQSLHKNPDGTVAHAQLVMGSGMIMLCSVPNRNVEFGRLIKQPDEIGGLVTQSVYLVIADTDGAYLRAKAADAEIDIDIKDESYGGRGFTCRDPEGQLWSVGSYDPWADSMDPGQSKSSS